MVTFLLPANMAKEWGANGGAANIRAATPASPIALNLICPLLIARRPSATRRGRHFPGRELTPSCPAKKAAWARSYATKPDVSLTVLFLLPYEGGRDAK